MRIFTAVALAVFLAGPALGQSVEIPSELTGQVRMSSGTRPAMAARVTLMKSGIPLADTFTDADGRFRFEKLQPGVYVLEVRMGKTVVSEAITLLGFHPDLAVVIPPETKPGITGSAVISA